MVEIDIAYTGSLRCRLTHGPSGTAIETDAPKDNHGRGEKFSPTDLVAAGLGACMLTTMGIVAQRHGIDLEGASVHVVKEMVNDPLRRIGRLAVTITFARDLDEKARRMLEETAAHCPVHRSLMPDVDIPIRFAYPSGRPAS